MGCRREGEETGKRKKGRGGRKGCIDLMDNDGTCFTGPNVFLNNSMFSSSNFARVNGMLKSIP